MPPMTSPRDRWPELFWFFEVVHQDYELEFSTPDACLADAAAEAPSDKLRSALSQWHEAFLFAHKDLSAAEHVMACSAADKSREARAGQPCSSWKSWPSSSPIWVGTM
jgi:hypothetical protein